MFKNLLIYRIAPGWEPELSVAEQALQAQHFSPCSPTQEQSSGWVPPRGHDHGPLIESIDSQWIMRWRTETKVLPADAVERKIDEKCAAIEAQTGRKPGRGERRDIKDEVRRSLLPNALTKQQGAWVWIAPKDRLLAIDVASPARADAILTALVDQLPGFVPRRIQTAQDDTDMSADLPDRRRSLFQHLLRGVNSFLRDQHIQCFSFSAFPNHSIQTAFRNRQPVCDYFRG